MPPRLPSGTTLEDLHGFFAEFGLKATGIADLGGMQNFVYEVMTAEGVPVVARLSVGRYRTQEEVVAELEWVAFLAEHGIPVSHPRRSASARWCERRNVGCTSQLLSAFSKSPGRKLERGDMTERVVQRIGELVGRIHSVSVAANRLGKLFGRNIWTKSRLLTHDLANTSAPIGAEFRVSVAQLIERIDQLPQTELTYGILHGDPSRGNFHIDGDQLWIFDFDNCEYGYFLQDLVVVLYDSLYLGLLKPAPPEILFDRVLSLWRSALAGYRSTGPLLSIDSEILRDCFLLREATIYLHLFQTLPNKPLLVDPVLLQMRKNVEAQSHDFDFSRLAHA